MENLTPESMPAWVVAFSWIYAGFIWIVTRETTIRLDSRIWGVTFIMVGLLYMLGYVPTTVDIHTVESLHLRLFVTRILMVLLSVSMWLPITVSYYRMVKRGLDTNNNSRRSSRWSQNS